MVLNPLHNPLPQNKGRLWELIIPRKLFIRCMVARQPGLLQQQQWCCGPFGLCLPSVDRWWTGESKWCKMGWIKIKMNTIALFINGSSPHPPPLPNLPWAKSKREVSDVEEKRRAGRRHCMQRWRFIWVFACPHYFRRKCFALRNHAGQVRKMTDFRLSRSCS